MIAQPYIRTSTDDKGQNPERQAGIIRRWAAAEGVTLLDPIIDEGSSASKDDAFTRPLFVAACERAAAANADAIVLEEPDRLSRLDGDVFGWTRHELRRRYGLRALFACFPLEMQDHMIGRILAGVKAEMGHEWVKQHSARVRSGMAQAKAEGRRVGRPRVELTTTELDLVESMRHTHGWPTIAHELSRRRGAFDVADRELQRRRSVSGPTIKARYAERLASKQCSTENNSPRYKQ